ncbi:MAG: hypothetical protein NT161_01160 [Candidatus Nomurabacteria bacterium]|nr:hypothetical protein [Candidatus Nomurabacteria bacterium]
MPRINRIDVGDIVYHVINRANARMQIFNKDEDYIKLVNEAQTNKEIESLRYSVNKGKPLGSDSWTNEMIDKFNLKATLRNPGRPNKGS